MNAKLAALDVHYDEDHQLGVAAGVVFADWQDAQPLSVHVRQHKGFEPYVPGQFYRRELPCLLPLIDAIHESTTLGVIVVDGHVDLDSGRPGLGRHLYEALGAEIEIIGVAKNQFRGGPAKPVYRGQSARPLWITSTGCVDKAVRAIASMHGPNRLPTLLRRVDRAARRGSED